MTFKHFHFATQSILQIVDLTKIENVAGTTGGSTISAKSTKRRKPTHAKILLSLMVLAMFRNFH